MSPRTIRLAARGALALWVVATVDVTVGVVTSAGPVLAATFTVLIALSVPITLQTGPIAAIGVLLDTFVVRTRAGAGARDGRRSPGPVAGRPGRRSGLPRTDQITVGATRR